ncbi:MAG: Gfo/Idh/MocA family oxidoreductase [Pseudomonadota bacterium]
MRIGLVGIGAIARKQHLPAIAGEAGVTLVAAASRNATLPHVPTFPSITKMLAEGPELDAVILCAPPHVRTPMAHEAIRAGKHVFLEKPPGQTISEVLALQAAARDKGVTLFATWHSRYAPAVEAFRSAMANHPPRSVDVIWKEDVRVYHPGQEWIWQAGGYGVFDPGINAVSILTHALPRPFFAVSGTLFVPQNAVQPMRAELKFTDSAGLPIACTFDFDHPDPPTWTMIVKTDGPTLTLTRGGEKLERDGETVVDAKEQEYPHLYARFADLCARGASDVDLQPLIHVADAWLLAERQPIAPFSEDTPPKG